jgi:hypothetical protein
MKTNKKTINMNTIEIEDIAVLFATEFVKMNRLDLQGKGPDNRVYLSNIPFLKMSYVCRKKLIDKVLSKLLLETTPQI